MFTFNETQPDFKGINEQAKELLEQIISKIKPKATEVKLPSNQPFSEFRSEHGIYLLTDGKLKCERAKRLLFVYDEGDLLGLEHHFFESDTRIFSEFVSVLVEYDKNEWLEKIGQDPECKMAWNKYLVSQIQLHNSMLTATLKEEIKVSPSFQNFRKGDIIINQNDVGKEVYVMIDGGADVFVDETKVGEVLNDEIFGALAALTNTPRTATVIAAQDSVVQVLPTDNFMELLETRPHTVVKLMDSMARIIVKLNEQVVKLSKSRTE